MEEQSDHILPEPTSSLEPVSTSPIGESSSEHTLVPGEPAASLERVSELPEAEESSSEHPPTSVESEAALESVPTSPTAGSSSEHPPTSVESEAALEETPELPEVEASLGDEPGLSSKESPSENSPASVDPEASPESVEIPSEVEVLLESAKELLEAEFSLAEMPAPFDGESSSEHTMTSTESDASLESVIAPPEPEIVLERVPGYLSVRETARMMGVSERSVYGYVENGKLPGARIGNIIVVVAEYVETYERKAPGRIRVTTPPWHMPPLKNLQFLTTITARLHPGQGDLLEHRLYEIRVAKKHRLLGTSARYIARNQHDPDEVEIMLIWRSAVMPSVDVRESALAAFYADLADIIDWETASRKESRVLMHA